MSPPLPSGNIAPSQLVPTGIPTVFNDPSNWTLIQLWDTRLGDMANMITGMGGDAFNNGFAWSYDGSRLTICNPGSSGHIYTFTCSTPFDPDTAGITPTADRAAGLALVPSSLQFNDSGSRAYAMRFGHDFIHAFACSGFVVGLATETSTLSKGDVGFTGAQEGGFIIHVDDSTVLWNGQDTLAVIKKISLAPAGDLSAFTVDGTEIIDPPISVNTHNIGQSVLSLDGASFYQCNTLISLVTMATPGDINTLSFGPFIDIDDVLGLGFLITRVWVNPNDTSEIWVGSSTSGVQLARLATNV